MVVVSTAVVVCVVVVGAQTVAPPVKVAVDIRKMAVAVAFPLVDEAGV